MRLFHRSSYRMKQHRCFQHRAAETMAYFVVFWLLFPSHSIIPITRMEWLYKTVQLYVHTHVQMYIWLYIHMYICMYSCTDVHMYRKLYEVINVTSSQVPLKIPMEPGCFFSGVAWNLRTIYGGGIRLMIVWWSLRPFNLSNESSGCDLPRTI